MKVLSSLWLTLVTDVDTATGRALVDSMTNEVVVRDQSIRGLGSGPVYLGSTRGRESTRHRLVVMPVLTGVGAFGAFYGAARLARHIPLLDQAIGGILRYADEGSTALTTRD